MKTRSREQFDKLLAIKKLIDGTPVEITYDQSRNTAQCVMVTPYPEGPTDEEILSQIEGTKIVEVKRFMRMVNGAVNPTNAFVLCVDSVTVPEVVRVGCVSTGTRPYYPRPMICFKCLIVGHTTAQCNSTPACPNCPMPENRSCNNPTRCKNWKGDHATLNHSCPVYLAERDIIRIKVDNCISYPEARKIYSQIQQVIEKRDFLKSQIQSLRMDNDTKNADSNHTDSNSDSDADANSTHDANMDTNKEQNIDTNNTNANNNTSTNTATQKDAKASTPIGPKRKASPSSLSNSSTGTITKEKIPHGNNSTPSKARAHKREKHRSHKRKVGFRY
ncbi:uncharacterized protein LOC121598765 [Anopheles merus]|uniref:uncharacterized protein LOC121598765 n=1 Tax=Anopheles merus TaxID=30066 RepID=UPI001BE404EF|nr:uncharacterized protein LOC121598765 [Anopheles merus]